MASDNKPPATSAEKTEQTAFDRSYVSSDRGEHRYPGQTAGERSARRERDDLKRRLAAPRFVAGLTRMAARVESAILKTPPRPAVIDDLRELVAALDRRVPHLEREGEIAIAHEAAALRADAMRRIEELEQEVRAARESKENPSPR